MCGKVQVATDTSGSCRWEVQELPPSEELKPYLVSPHPPRLHPQLRRLAQQLSQPTPETNPESFTLRACLVLPPDEYGLHGLRSSDPPREVITLKTANASPPTPPTRLRAAANSSPLSCQKNEAASIMAAKKIHPAAPAQRITAWTCIERRCAQSHRSPCSSLRPL